MAHKALTTRIVNKCFMLFNERSHFGLNGGSQQFASASLDNLGQRIR